MDILLKGVTVIDSSSTLHQQTTDILIQDGIITRTGTIDSDGPEIIAMPGLHISPGFLDIFAQFCDPGFEARETLVSGATAAAYGGYTDVFILPNTHPVIHHKSGVEYVVQKSGTLPVTLHPVGAITKDALGKELAEMYDMHYSGAVAFSDGLLPLQQAGVMLKALQYVKAIDKIIIQVPDDQSLSTHGLMNEGIISTQLGLAGMPAIAEELMIARDIELAKYTGAKLHLTGVSTGKGIEAVRNAKEQGVALTCSITPHHLTFCDEDLQDYDTNLKVNPPLRSRSDVASLRAAVSNGIIDCIASHHLPQHTDQKIVEFEYAKNGMSSLETCFAAVRTAVPQVALEKLIALFTTMPRRIFGLPPVTIAVGEPACLSLYLPNEKWVPSTLFSKSKNTAFLGKSLTGKPVGIIHKDKLFLKP